MVRVLQFINLYNNMCQSHIRLKRFKFYESTKPIIKIMLDLGLISFYKFYNHKDRKYIYIKISKKNLKLKTVLKKKRITYTASELNKISIIDKSIFILCNDKGWVVHKPFKKIKNGGLVIAKIEI